MGKCSDSFSTLTFESAGYLRTMMDNCPLESVTTNELSRVSRFMECGDTMVDSCPNSSQPELQQGCLLGPCKLTHHLRLSMSKSNLLGYDLSLNT